MDTGSGRTDEAPLQSPEVIACGECRAILGDNLVACHGAEKTTASTVLSSCPGVERGGNVTTASFGPEAGSTYDLLLCTACKARVGCIFLATLPAFDWMRGQFALYPDATSRYRLGTGADATDVQRTLERLPHVANGSGGAAGEASGCGDQQSSSAADIEQLKRVAVAMSERIDSLEEKVRELRREGGGRAAWRA